MGQTRTRTRGFRVGPELPGGRGYPPPGLQLPVQASAHVGDAPAREIQRCRMETSSPRPKLWGESTQVGPESLTNATSSAFTPSRARKPARLSLLTLAREA